MQKSGNLPRNNSLRLAASPQSIRRLGFCSQITTGQHSSPIVFPEKRNKGRNSARQDRDVGASDFDDPKKDKREEHKIDIGDEQSDLLGYEVFTGKLVLDKKKSSKNDDKESSKEIASQDFVDAKLTSKAMVWGSQMLSLEDVISVSFIHLIVKFMFIFKPLCL